MLSSPRLCTIEIQHQYAVLSTNFKTATFRSSRARSTFLGRNRALPFSYPQGARSPGMVGIQLFPSTILIADLTLYLLARFVPTLPALSILMIGRRMCRLSSSCDSCTHVACVFRGCLTGAHTGFMTHHRTRRTACIAHALDVVSSFNMVLIFLFHIQTNTVELVHSDHPAPASLETVHVSYKRSSSPKASHMVSIYKAPSSLQAEKSNL